MMIAPNFLVGQKEGGLRGIGRRGERLKKDRTDRNFDARRGRSRRSNSFSYRKMNEFVKV